MIIIKLNLFKIAFFFRFVTTFDHLNQNAYEKYFYKINISVHVVDVHIRHKGSDTIYLFSIINYLLAHYRGY
jgi:hypothetical protein